MKIFFLPEVLIYFNELTGLLYQKGYFGLEENALKYVDELLERIRTYLPNHSKRYAPSYFNRYGYNMFYVVFKKSKQTHWYVFFNIYEDKGELIYLIRHITNNHVAAQHFNQ